jgi:hypothetical protein
MPRNERWKQDTDGVQIDIWVTYDGVNYSLHPFSEELIQERFPDARPLPSIFLGHESRAEFPARHKPLWERMAMMLTGLTLEQIAELGGFSIFNPETKKLVWRWKPARKRSTA